MIKTNRKSCAFCYDLGNDQERFISERPAGTESQQVEPLANVQYDVNSPSLSQETTFMEIII